MHGSGLVWSGVSVSVCVCLCLSVSVCLCLSVRPSFRPSVIRLSVRPSVCPFVRLSTCVHELVCECACVRVGT